MSMQVLETIGFDLGHGETAVARRRWKHRAPEMRLITRSKSQRLAGILGTLVGEQALIQTGVTNQNFFLSKKTNNDQITGRQSAVLLKPTAF